MTITATIDDTRKVLVITADEEGREELLDAEEYQKREVLVLEALYERFEWVRPEEIGALTDSPIFCRPDDIEYPEDSDERTIREDARIFWFPDYAIRDEWEELATKGVVEFTEAV